MTSAVEPLKYPHFRWLWAGNVFSASGTFVQSVAASWLMFELTQSGTWVGLGLAMLLTLTRVSMMNFQTWQEISFSFTATPEIMLTSIIAGAGMGILGGLLPAFKAAGVSPIEAMRG